MRKMKVGVEVNFQFHFQKITPKNTYIFIQITRNNTILLLFVSSFFYLFLYIYAANRQLFV